MVDFRKFMLALVVGALMFASFASAQIVNPYACTATAVPPIVRAEGLAELVGDIVLVCSGTPNALLTANIRVTLNTNVTSDVENASSTPVVLESLLLLDEGVAPLVAYNGSTPRVDGTQNIYQAIKVSGTERELEWQEVALYNSASQPTQVIRLTNIRANAQGLGAGGQVTAHVNITGTATVPVTNNNLNVADIRQGVVMKATAATYKRCESPQGNFTLSFTEGSIAGSPNLASSFKTKGPSAINNVPGVAYPNESGWVPYNTSTFAALFSGSMLADSGVTKPGVASQGTRLVAELEGIPAGVSLAVVNNTITNGNGLSVQYVPAPSGGWPASGTFPNYFQSAPAAGTTVVKVGDKAAIVYEVIASPTASVSLGETVDIAVSVSYSTTDSDANLLGTALANGTFGPVSAVPTASASEAEPRFVYSATNKQTAFTVGPCRTILLFPYLTNAPGFDTGLAISNTTADPLNTRAQAGTCGLNFYGTKSGAALTAAQAAQVTPSIPSGGQFIMLLSAAVGSVIDPSGATPAACTSGNCLLPGFQGYMFAVCNFQFAHGFAFVSDLGATKLAMGYLALVVPDRGTSAGSRLPAVNSFNLLNNQGEQLAQ